MESNTGLLNLDKYQGDLINCLRLNYLNLENITCLFYFNYGKNTTRVLYLLGLFFTCNLLSGIA
jgi:hypothetical protein